MFPNGMNYSKFNKSIQWSNFVSNNHKNVIFSGFPTDSEVVFKSKRVAFSDGVMPASIVVCQGKIQAVKNYNVDRVELGIDEYDYYIFNFSLLYSLFLIYMQCTVTTVPIK